MMENSSIQFRLIKKNKSSVGSDKYLWESASCGSFTVCKDLGKKLRNGSVREKAVNEAALCVCLCAHVSCGVSVCVCIPCGAVPLLSWLPPFLIVGCLGYFRCSDGSS